MSSGAQPDWFSQNAPQAPAQQGQDWFSSNAPTAQDNDLWSKAKKIGNAIWSATPIGDLSDKAGEVQKWADQKFQDQVNPAKNPNPDARATFGLGVLRDLAGMVHGATSPAGAGITAATIAAPELAGPALLAHGAYGMSQVQGSNSNPDALQQRLLAGSEMAGGAAATGQGFSQPTPLSSAIANKVGGTDLAQRLYKSALKPSTTLDSAKVASQIQEGLDQGVPVSKGGQAKLSSLIDDVNNEIAQKIQSNQNAPINKFSVASRLGQTANRFATQVNPAADLNAVARSGNEFLNSQPTDIPAQQAQALKQGTYQQLSSKAYGELGTATTESQKALARGLKEELANAFPELNDLNAKDSRLIGLDDMMERAVNRISNHQLGGIGTPLAAAGAKAVTGSNAAAGAAGILKAVLDDPYVKSRFAIALNHASGGNVTVPMANAKIAGYANALAASASAQAPNDQESQ